VLLGRCFTRWVPAEFPGFGFENSAGTLSADGNKHLDLKRRDEKETE